MAEIYTVSMATGVVFSQKRNWSWYSWAGERALSSLPLSHLSLNPLPPYLEELSAAVLVQKQRIHSLNVIHIDL